MGTSVHTKGRERAVSDVKYEQKIPWVTIHRGVFHHPCCHEYDIFFETPPHNTPLPNWDHPKFPLRVEDPGLPSSLDFRAFLPNGSPPQNGSPRNQGMEGMEDPKSSKPGIGPYDGQMHCVSKSSGSYGIIQCPPLYVALQGVKVSRCLSIRMTSNDSNELAQDEQPNTTGGG